jgi:lipopolysaccharide transport system permease protein
VTQADARLSSAPSKPLLTIERRTGWIPLDLSEIWHFRDLLLTLAGRDIRLRYRQTALGIAWVFLQPLIAAGLFSLVFGFLADMPRGALPYFVLSYTGMLVFNVFNSTLSKAGICLVGNSQLVSKVYFPRMVLPLSTAISSLLDFVVATLLLIVMLAAYHQHVAIGLGLLLAPVWLAMVLMLALGFGLWASALTVSFRDVQYVLPVLLQFAMYATPVGYRLKIVQEKTLEHHWPRLFNVYMLNPLASIIEAFRWSCLGPTEGELHLGWLLYSFGVAVVVLLLGSVAFRRMERKFADII